MNNTRIIKELESRIEAQGRHFRSAQDPDTGSAKLREARSAKATAKIVALTGMLDFVRKGE